MGSVLKLPEESCSVIKLMHCKKARLQVGIIGIERGSQDLYLLAYISESPALVLHTVHLSVE